MPPRNSRTPQWARFETYVQKILGLKSTPGSGNQFNAPGDGRTSEHYSVNSIPLMVDAKHTTQKSYSLTKQELGQWVKKAALFGCRFGLPIRFDSGEYEEDYIVVQLDFFTELYQSFVERKGDK